MVQDLLLEGINTNINIFYSLSGSVTPFLFLSMYLAYVTMLILVNVIAIVQAGGGTANVLLYAPAWLQVLHLGLAVSLWVATVLLWVAVLAARDPDLIGAPPETP